MIANDHTNDLAVGLFRNVEPLPADQQSAAVYLSGLSAGSKPAMSQALNSTAQIWAPGTWARKCTLK